MSRIVANSLLLITALIWGTTFVAQQLGMDHVGPLTYTGLRFLIGAAFVSPLALREYVKIKQRGVHISAQDMLAWGGLGCLLFLGAVLQQIGITGTSVSNAGFLTALSSRLEAAIRVTDAGKRFQNRALIEPAETYGSFRGCCGHWDHSRLWSEETARM